MAITNINDKLATAKALLEDNDRLVSMFYIEPDSGDCKCWKGHTCESPGKHPRENWKDRDQHIATYERAVEAFGPGSDPLLGIGRLAGRETGKWFIDVDPRHGGDESLKRLCNDLEVDLTTTRTWPTGGGGWHLEFNYPADTEITNANRNLKAKYPGLDVRGDGGLVKVYGPHNGLHRVDAPQALIDLIQTPTDLVGTCSVRSGMKTLMDLPDTIQKRCNGYAETMVANQIGRFATEYDLEGWDDLVNAVAFTTLIEANCPWNDLEMGSIERDYKGDYSVSSNGVVGLLYDNAPRGGDERWSENRIAKCIYSAYTSVKRRDLVRDIPAPIKADLAKVDQKVKKEPGILPEEFWSARPALARIRQAARSRRRSGEAALAGLFARFGAMVDPRVKVDTGIAEPLSLNAFTALIGPSGTGKSASKSIPKRLVPTPTFSEFSDREYVGLGSGEGMIEAYLDFVTVETGELKKNGDPVTVTRKQQVYKNVLFYLDEGESLTTLLGRNGSTLGATIRSAWMGEKLGQMNAQKETTRTLTEGMYSMGFIVGLQYEACSKLMEDAAYGTPHRFYFSRVTDPNQPDERCEWPGDLSVNPVKVANDSSGFTVAASITDRLDQQDLARQRGELKVDKLNTHEPAMRAKLSAFIAALDGRTLITEEDWELSGHMWQASCEVRDDVMDYLDERKAAEISAKDQVYVNREVKIDEAKRENNEVARKEAKLAKRVANWIHESEDRLTYRDVGQKMNSTDRKLLEKAVALGELRDWFHFDLDGKTLLPGDSRPTE